MSAKDGTCTNDVIIMTFHDMDVNGKYGELLRDAFALNLYQALCFSTALRKKSGLGTRLASEHICRNSLYFNNGDEAETYIMVSIM